MYRILLTLPDTVTYGRSQYDEGIITVEDRATADDWARLFLLRYDANQVAVVDVSAELSRRRLAELRIEHEYAAAWARVFGHPRPEAPMGPSSGRVAEVVAFRERSAVQAGA